jgi:preprotein translocase subunit YajC
VSFLIVMVLLLGVMYVMMIRPQRRRQAQHQTMIEGAGVGEDVLTTGGIYGTVTEVEGDDLVVEIADGVSVHMTRRGIAAVLPPEEEEDEEEDEDVLDADASDELDEVEADEVEAGADEAPITDGEEAVTSEIDTDAAAADRR